MTLRTILGLLALALLTASLEAAVPAKVLRETAEAVTRKFGRESLGEGTEAFMKRLDDQATRFGADTVLPAVRAAGPSALHVAARYGDEAGPIYRTFARWGTKAARVCDDPALGRLVIRHGDEAAEALVRHPGVADGLVTRFGDEAAGALVQVNRRNAGRLARLADEGLFTTSPRHAGLFGVVRRYGDEGLDFIWRHKGILAGGAVLAAFLADPEPYLSGARELAAEVAGTVIEELSPTTNWNLVLPVVAAILTGALLLYCGLRFGFRRHRAPA